MQNENSNSDIWNADTYFVNSSAQQQAALHILSCIQWKGNEQVLDVGCGDGKITAILAQKLKNGRVLGIDNSQEMVNFAKTHFFRENLEFLFKDGEKISYESQFDVIFSSFALQWMLNPVLFFKKAHQALKPTGLLALTIPTDASKVLEIVTDKTINSKKWSSYFCNFVPNWNFLNEGKYKELLIFSKFEIQNIETIQQTIKFSSRKTLQDYIAQWFVYLQHIPNELKSSFITEIIDQYLIEEPELTTGEVVFSFHRVDILAKKS